MKRSERVIGAARAQDGLRRVEKTRAGQQGKGLWGWRPGRRCARRPEALLLLTYFDFCIGENYFEARNGRKAPVKSKMKPQLGKQMVGETHVIELIRFPG